MKNATLAFGLLFAGILLNGCASSPVSKAPASLNTQRETSSTISCKDPSGRELHLTRLAPSDVNSAHIKCVDDSAEIANLIIEGNGGKAYCDEVFLGHVTFNGSKNGEKGAGSWALTVFFGGRPIELIPADTCKLIPNE